MASEKEFHRRRTAFVVLNAGILIAKEGFEGSHFDLLKDSGFSESQAKEIIENRPRGFSLDGNVYAYQGESFLPLTVEKEEAFRVYIPFFKQSGLLSREGKVYSGMQAGKPGDLWQGVKEIEFF